MFMWFFLLFIVWIFELKKIVVNVLCNAFITCQCAGWIFPCYFSIICFGKLCGEYVIQVCPLTVYVTHLNHFYLQFYIFLSLFTHFICIVHTCIVSKTILLVLDTVEASQFVLVSVLCMSIMFFLILHFPLIQPCIKMLV